MLVESELWVLRIEKGPSFESGSYLYHLACYWRNKTPLQLTARLMGDEFRPLAESIASVIVSHYLFPSCHRNTCRRVGLASGRPVKFQCVEVKPRSTF